MPFTDLAFRFDDAPTPARAQARARLIRDEFEIDLAALARFGVDLGVVSFGWWRGGDLVAHAALAPQRLFAEGREIAAFALQWVTVRPDLRGLGLFRDLMGRALAHARARAEVVTLTTESPELYERFGFRPVAETSFAGPLAPGGGPANHRRLDLGRAEDAALVVERLIRRVPVSLAAGDAVAPAFFLLKALESPEIELHHLADFDAVVAIEREEAGTLTLLDVVAAEIPPLAAIAAALGGGERRARVLFTPDRLDWTPREAIVEDGGLMARGMWPLEGRPFQLSTMRV